MLESLGVAWSCTVLAMVSAALGIVPFLFIAFGERIRAGSRFSRSLRDGGGGGGNGNGAGNGGGNGVGSNHNGRVEEGGLTRSLSAV